MKKLLLALALFLAPSLAFAQCNGVFPANTVCGNSAVSGAPPKAGVISNFTAVTQPTSDNTTKIATDAFVHANIAALSITRAQIASTIVPVTTFTITGYSTAGDGCAGYVYTSQGASSGSPMAIQDAASTWFQLVLNGPTNVACFGAIGNGSTDTTAAVTIGVSDTATAKVPLQFTGGGSYVVDSLPLVSNVNIVGDGNTTIKLKNNAVGSVFLFNASLSNVSISYVIINGNLAGQSTPHDLLNSVFWPDTGTLTCTGCNFDHLVVNNAAGAVFSHFGTGTLDFTNSFFRNITVNKFWQTAISLGGNGNILDTIILNNSGGVVRGTAYGVQEYGDNNQFLNFQITLSDDASVTTDQIGFENNGENNIVNGIIVDCSNNAHSWATSFNGALGPKENNQLSNAIVKQNVVIVDYEIVNQGHFTASNLDSINSAGGIIISGDTHNVTVSDFNFDGASGADAITIKKTGSDTPREIVIQGWHMHGGRHAIEISEGYNIGIYNGTVRGITGNAIDGGTGTDIKNLIVSGLTIDGAALPITLANVVTGAFSNITAINLTNTYMVWLAGNSNIHFSNINGISTTGGSGSVGRFQGTWDGTLTTFYYEAVSGGSIGTYSLGEQLPNSALIKRVYYKTRVALTSGTSTATVALGFTGSNAVFKAATIISDASWSAAGTGAHNSAVDGTPANFVWNSGGSPVTLNMTIAGEALTAGLIEIFVEWVPAP